MLDYRRYRLTDCVACIYTDSNLSLHKVKCKGELLYQTLEPFSDKEPKEILGFLSTTREDFYGKCLREGLETCELGFFLTSYAQTEYTNVVNHVINDSNRLPFTWPLIIHFLLNRFITDDLLRIWYYAMTSVHIYQSESEMCFD